jgi:hypothetical protein
MPPLAPDDVRPLALDDIPPFAPDDVPPALDDAPPLALVIVAPPLPGGAVAASFEGP